MGCIGRIQRSLVWRCPFLGSGSVALSGGLRHFPGRRKRQHWLYTRVLYTRQSVLGCSFHAWQPICSDYLKIPQFTFLPSLTISHIHSFREQEPSHSAETTNHMPRMYTTPIPSSRATVSPKNGDATDPNTSPLASTRHVRTSYVASHAMTSLYRQPNTQYQHLGFSCGQRYSANGGIAWSL